MTNRSNQKTRVAERDLARFHTTIDICTLGLKSEKDSGEISLDHSVWAAFCEELKENSKISP